jgi:hypothetical protein
LHSRIPTHHRTSPPLNEPAPDSPGISPRRADQTRPPCQRRCSRRRGDRIGWLVVAVHVKAERLSGLARYVRKVPIVLKNSKTAGLRKSRECSVLAISAAARRCRIDTRACDLFYGNSCGPSTRSKGGRTSGHENFQSSAKKDFFNTIGRGRDRSKSASAFRAPPTGGSPGLPLRLTEPRPVIAKFHWHPGGVVSRVGFIVTNPADRVVAFYNQRGPSEQWRATPRSSGRGCHSGRSCPTCGFTSCARLQSEQLPESASSIPPLVDGVRCGTPVLEYGVHRQLHPASAK